MRRTGCRRSGAHGPCLCGGRRGQGVGGAIAERLLAEAGTVIVIERNRAGRMPARPAGARPVAAAGDAGVWLCPTPGGYAATTCAGESGRLGRDLVTAQGPVTRAPGRSA
jgi:hypothetical protein